MAGDIFTCPVAAAPYRAYGCLSPLRNDPGRASAAPPGNGHQPGNGQPALLPAYCPVAAAPYRAYGLFLPAP
ncbi:hypothetical protein NUBL21974_02270 [Klebsiella quasipneumoniae]|nr:hypothetical protein NUBL21974_02270 [Klebsiella quasipneumoniae]